MKGGKLTSKKMEQKEDRIYDPDNLIRAYSEYFNRDLFYQTINKREIPIGRHTLIDELMPRKIELCQLSFTT